MAFAVEFLFSLGSPYPSASGSAWASSHAKTWSLCLGQVPGCPWGWLDLFLFPFGLKALPDLAILFSGITTSSTWVTLTLLWGSAPMGLSSKEVGVVCVCPEENNSGLEVSYRISLVAQTVKYLSIMQETRV